MRYFVFTTNWSTKYSEKLLQIKGVSFYTRTHSRICLNILNKMLAFMNWFCYNMDKSGYLSDFFIRLAKTQRTSYLKGEKIMMTRNIRKVVSIVCAVAILMSL